MRRVVGQVAARAAAKLPPESSGRCLRDRAEPGSALEDLVLVDGHRSTEPVLVLRHGDVALCDGLGGVAAVSHREVEVLLGREVARVRPPGLPLLAGGAAAHEQERRSHHQHSPVLAAAHTQVLPPGVSKLAHPTFPREDGQLAVRARLLLTTSREIVRMDALKIHSRPGDFRRPILIMAFGGWNDAAESATNAVRYLGTSFQAQKFAEIDPEEFYHFGLARPHVPFKPAPAPDRGFTWQAAEFSISQASALARDVIVGVAIEPHLRWKTYCATVLELVRQCDVTLVLTLGALLAEVPHTRPVRLSGTASDPELAVRLGARPTKYEGPTGIVGVLNTVCKEQGFATASLWANVPHYISGIENPRATLALVQRVAPLLGATVDVAELDEAVKQFDSNLKEIVAQNAKIANYIKKLESRDAAEETPPAAQAGPSDLPPASQLVAEIEQFLRQQRPE